MRDMELKVPAVCCGDKHLLWNRVRWRYICSCGQLEVSMNGTKIKPGKSSNSLQYGKGKTRPL